MKNLESLESNNKKFPLIEKNREKIQSNIWDYSGGDIDKQIAIGLYLQTGEVKSDDENVLLELEDKFGANEELSIEQQRENLKNSIQEALDRNLTEFPGVIGSIEWKSIFNLYLKKGGKISDFKTKEGSSLTPEIINSMDYGPRKHKAQEDLQYLEELNLNKYGSDLEWFLEKGGKITDLRTKHNNPLDEKTFNDLKKKYLKKQAEYSLRALENDPSEYSESVIRDFEKEFGDLSLLKTKENKPVDENYLKDLYKKHVAHWLQKEMLDLEEHGKNPKTTLSDLDEYIKLGGKLSELKTKDGNPVTKEYLKYISELQR